jgi:hypothetical protein
MQHDVVLLAILAARDEALHISKPHAESHLQCTFFSKCEGYRSTW